MGETIPKKEWLSVPDMLSLCYMKVSSRMPRGFVGISGGLLGVFGNSRNFGMPTMEGIYYEGRRVGRP